MMKNIFQFLEKIGIWILGGLCILPFLVLSYFIHPVGAHGWDWVTQFPGELPAGLNLFDQQSYWYNNMMGRYASTAVMSLTHFWFSISAFKLFPIVFIFLMFGSLYYLFKSMIDKVTSSHLVNTGFLSIAIFLIYLDQLAGIYEAFYNLSCVLTYQIGGISFFLLVGLMIRIFTQKKSKSWGNMVLLCLLIFFTVGSNEVCLVATNGWLSLLILGGFYYRKKWPRWIIGLFLFSLTCSFFEILAPGNFVRMELSTEAQNPFLAIFLTLSVSTFNWIRWFSTTPLLVFAVLYLPIGVKLAQSQKEHSIFKYPLFGVLGIVSFQWLSLLLLFWSQGDEALPERMMDLIFWISLPLLFYICQCLIVVFLKKKWVSPPLSFSPIIRWSLLAFVVFHLFFSGLKIDKSDDARSTSNYLSIIQTNSNIGNAWLEILNGNASTYNKEQYLIYEKVKSCTVDTCFITPSIVNPKIIYDETYDRKTKSGEHFMSYYFGKSIIVKYEDAIID